MPIIKFDRVVSCSSEDPNHPAKNLLKTETYKKWKCKSPGEDQISVVLQLEKSSLISGIDIGNEYSAFVEVLVTRSTGNTEDFKVLLVASSFMAPLEARNGENPNRVRMFSRDHLSKPAVDERWDRVKVVCRQPFNRHVQYGLTFLKLHTSQDERSGEAPPKEPHQTKLGRFVVRDEESEGDDLRVGSLFAVKHGATVAGGLLGGPHKTPPATGAAAIMDASKPQALASAELSRKKLSPGLRADKASPAGKKTDAQSQQKDPKETQRNGITPTARAADKTHNGKIDVVGSGPSPKRARMSDDAQAATGTRKPKQEAKGDSGRRPPSAQAAGPKKKARAEVPFSKLLNGVTLVISGYQNPLRANLREAALQMGAKYRPDWGPGCTHLVCAFPNTPKFNQVKGHGKIIRKEWVEDCHSQRKRLPWRRYAMDKKDQTGRESDTEEETESMATAEDQNESSASLSSQSDESDGDEPRTPGVNPAQRNSPRPSLFAPLGGDKARQVRTPATNRQQQQQRQSRTASPPASSAASNPFDADTDVDEDADLPSDSDLPPLPPLPNFFKDTKFRLGPSLAEDRVEQLKRYITAYGGEVVPDVGRADYLVTDRIKDCEKLRFDHSRCTAVRPAWVWECNDTKTLAPTAPFELE